MAEIIDITNALQMKKIAENLAGNGKIFCHPDDAHRFDFLPPNKVVSTCTMETGKPYAIDVKAMLDFLSPERLVLDLPTKG